MFLYDSCVRVCVFAHVVLLVLIKQILLREEGRKLNTHIHPSTQCKCFLLIYLKNHFPNFPINKTFSRFNSCCAALVYVEGKRKKTFSTYKI